MTQKFLFLSVLFVSLSTALCQSTDALRIYIRAGEKTHGPDQHDHPRFLSEWKTLLNERGAKTEGALNFPSNAQLENSDVLVMYAAEAGTVSPEQRASLEKFLKRGGGLVVIHDAVCGADPHWFKTIIGGAWEHKHSKWFEGNIGFYVQDYTHPITKGFSNFDFDDELYYDLHLMPEAKILAATYAPDKRNTRDGKMFPSVYDIVPQMWTYERENYRAFVSIPGHNHKTFNLPQFRALLLRGIAWAGKRDVDSLVSKEELASLRYPEGGPTAPEKAAGKITVHPDFNLNLVTAEPLIEKPISLDWDAQGRLWIAETPEYPNGRKIETSPNDHPEIEDRPARDRISILEDSNGDGLMDKKSVFFEGLELVTSFVFHRDGVIVAQAPDIYWLRDANGDGKAEIKETLYTGFGTRDTHAVISNLRWGMDGWIYATLGYSGGSIKSGDGKKDFGGLSSGVIRFKPDGRAMEQVSSKGGNTWGLDFAPDGELFFSQANGNHINHVVMSENALARGKVSGATSFKNIEDHNRSFPIRHYDKQAYVQIDVVGGFTAASGCTIYNGGAWPDEWNYNHFVSEPTVNLVHRDILKPNGATYLASKDRETEFIASTDLWFRPIHHRVGPDGALYILDFYNQAVVHNDTRGPRHGPNNAAFRPDRDHYFGRIWRVQHKEAKKFEIPNLSKASPAELIKALDHPNDWVRMTAQRSLSENKNDAIGSKLDDLLKSKDVSDSARISALWLLYRLEKLDTQKFISSFRDEAGKVRKNALRIAGEKPELLGYGPKLTFSIFPCLKDPDPRIRLAAICALGAFPTTEEVMASLMARSNSTYNVYPITEKIAEELVALYPDLQDAWSQSATVGVAAKVPLKFINVAFDSKNCEGLKSLVAELSNHIANKQDAKIATQLLEMIAENSDSDLAQSALENLSKTLKPEVVPEWSSALQNAFHSLLISKNSAVTAAALPLITRWDKDGAMSDEVKSLLPKLFASLKDATQPDEQREQAINSLLGLRETNPEILPSVAKILGSNSSTALQQRLVETLGRMGDAEVGNVLIETYPRVSPELQENIFQQIVRRADWSLALVDAIKNGKINLGALPPAAIHRLRTHGDAKVAQAANQAIEQLRGPEAKEKNALVAKFAPLVEKSGNAENGHKIFTANCASCHKFQGDGKEVAPDLTGMGVHGSAELLVHILDPNRVVEPNYISYSIETKDDQSLDGIIATENKKSIVLRNASGDFEVERKNVASQRSTGRSLMPEGFEALGEESLRDLLTYLSAGENRFRVLDLKKAFTANSGRGIYNSPEATEETLSFKKFGMIKVGEVPFEIISPSKTISGNNLINLKGGNGFAKTMPQKVEITDVNVKANKLHFLGGVGGWAFPWGNGTENKNLPVAKLTVHFADGKAEEFIMKNGDEFADYIGHQDVPGSKAVPDLVNRGQVRWFTKSLQHAGLIQKLSLESFDNLVAPTFVAITAEVSEGKENPQPAAAEFQWDKHPRVLIVGGGSSHDFNRWFHQADSQILSAKASVNYTEDISRVGAALKNIDALYLCNNQPFTGESLRKAIFDFAESGKPLLLTHPALWYNWKDWPEYNRVLVGGGSRGHEKYGEFEVSIDEPSHPIMAGVPKTFKLADELYRHEPDTNGTPMQVLATGKSLVTGKTYPVVWISKHPKTKIVCITLGHDAGAHELPAYKKILQNSIDWLTQKQTVKKNMFSKINRLLAAILVSANLHAAAPNSISDPEYLAQFKLEPATKAKGLILKEGDRLAICGDSITEQKMYSRIMETYLTVALPEFQISARQYGWGGERAPGFLARMTNDVLRFKPTIATTCYGMNDHEYRAYEPKIGETYRTATTAIVKSFKNHGARVVVGSPGCVGAKVPWAKTNSLLMNQNLAQLRNIDIEIAKKEKVRFADVFGPMLQTDFVAREKFGDEFQIPGKDGVHPGWAGHLVMAYSFLKSFGLDGEIGTFTVDLKSNEANASKGHEVISFQDGELKIESSRYPFCATGDPTKDDNIRSAMGLVPFNKELNRLMLVVKRGKAENYKVTWGKETKTYTAEQLGRGVNLADEFHINPFSEAFNKVDEAVAAKQAYETKQIKQIFRSAEAKADMEAVAIQTEKERDPLVAAIKAAFVPVTHTIKISAE